MAWFGLKNQLVDVIARHPNFANPRHARLLLERAVGSLRGGRVFLDSLDFDGEPEARARDVVSIAEDQSRPPGDFLRPILLILKSEASDNADTTRIEALVEKLSDSCKTQLVGRSGVESRTLSEAEAVGTDRAGSVPTDPNEPAEVYPASVLMGDFVMLSFSHADISSVRGIVERLRNDGVTVIWDQDQEVGSDIPLWVLSTY